ncbi:MAG: thioredoxin domain-containing protein [Flavobacteriaceae bacterium]
MNKLANQKSLYLKQHSTNPVDWMPWGSEALDLAKQENKLVLISVGYSSCHWCHVMEEETFSNSEVAEVMNSNFINIKVDREERPDVDELYMKSLVLMTGSGGWPMNIIALPDGSPIWGGTYLPKTNWMSVLVQIDELFKKRFNDVQDYANKLKKGLQQENIIQVKLESEELFEKIRETSSSSFEFTDKTNGGLKTSQKFHLPSMLNFFLRAGYQFDEKKYHNHVNLTLQNIAFGGINDHVGGGLHRYTVDSIWHVPHFEKMLYDNAQMLSVFSKAYKSNNDLLYKDQLEKIFNFIERDLTSSENLIYSSISAITEINNKKVEGDFYVWNKNEIKNTLKDNYEIFSEYFNINEFGYWEKDKYILKREKDNSYFTKKFKISNDKLEKILSKSLIDLNVIREKRVKPEIDKKVITSWNALTVIGLNDAFEATGDKKYLKMALEITEAIEENLIDDKLNIKRSLSISDEKIQFLEDYSYLISAYLGLYQSTFDYEWIEKAVALTNKSIEIFSVSDSSFFKFSSDQSLLFTGNFIDLRDGVIPSANSIMSNNLFMLSHYTGNRDYLKKGDLMIKSALNKIMSEPLDYMNWLNVALSYSKNFYEIVITGKDAYKMSDEIKSKYLPNVLIAASKKDSKEYLLNNRYVNGENLIYVCVNNSCKFPVNKVTEALKILND